MTFAAKFDITAYKTCTQVNVCLKAPPLAITSANPAYDRQQADAD
jgi:hypothetical protein